MIQTFQAEENLMPSEKFGHNTQPFDKKEFIVPRINISS